MLGNNIKSMLQEWKKISYGGVLWSDNHTSQLTVATHQNKKKALKTFRWRWESVVKLINVLLSRNPRLHKCGVAPLIMCPAEVDSPAEGDGFPLPVLKFRPLHFIVKKVWTI